MEGNAFFTARTADRKTGMKTTTPLFSPPPLDWCWALKEIRCAEGDKKLIFLFGKMPNLSSRAQKAQTVGCVLAGAFCRLGIMGTPPMFVYFFFVRCNTRSGSFF